MSDINLDFTVSNNSIDFTVEPNDITITPTDIQLNFSTGGGATPDQPLNSVQFNENNEFTGSDNFKFYSSNATIAVTNINVGNDAIFTSNVDTIHITGGQNHYYLQTDGTGNLTWAVGTGNMQGNGTVAGANTQIQFNDGGMSFGGNAGFTFNKITGNVDIPGNVNIVGNVFALNLGNANFAANANYANFAGNVVNSSQPNITNVGTLTSLNVSGTTSIYQGIENVAIIGAQTGTYNYNLLDGAIQYSTANSTANIILNYRGNSSVTANTMLANGKSITSTYILTNGANTNSITGVQIDGSAQSIKWASNVVPGVFPNAALSYTFTIIKTSTTPTYAVLGSMTRYG